MTKFRSEAHIVPYFSGCLLVYILLQKEAVVKKEEEKRKQLMKDQRQKTIQRVKQYMEVTMPVSFPG